MIRRLRARWRNALADLATPFDFDLPEEPTMPDPVEAPQDPAPATCTAQHCAERARADALEARLAVLQEANMAADVAPRGFAVEAVSRG